MPQTHVPPALSLDSVLDMDHARQCLVFSPVDPLPRLDLADLHLDLEKLEHALGLARAPAPLPSVLNVPRLSYEELGAAHALAAQPLHVEDELLAHARSEGWSLSDVVVPMRAPPVLPSPTELDRLAVHLEGTIHPPELRKRNAVPTTAPASGPSKWLAVHAAVSGMPTGEVAP